MSTGQPQLDVFVCPTFHTEDRRVPVVGPTLYCDLVTYVVKGLRDVRKSRGPSGGVRTEGPPQDGYVIQVRGAVTEPVHRVRGKV